MYKITVEENGEVIKEAYIVDGDVFIFDPPGEDKILSRTQYLQWKISRLERQLGVCHNIMKNQREEAERLQGILDKVQV